MWGIKRLFVWAMRIGYCRGFGVQSPWAYSFIRYVVNEHYPYYSYDALAKRVVDARGITAKLCRLYFRISNYCQPCCILDFGAATDAYREYFCAGCKKADVVSLRDDMHSEEYSGILASMHSVDMVRISLTGNYREFYSLARVKATPGAVFIIEGIKRDHKSRRMWKEIVSESCAVSFDLYYCGVVFFDEKRYRQNYIVNF